MDNKRRNLDSLKKRKTNSRTPSEIVLIVCEGEKTEPNYFRGLCDDLKLNNVKVLSCPEGNDPMTIVSYSIKEFKKDRGYDYVYCVFDKEQHTKYQAALNKINENSSKKNRIPIHAITSVPCFEYWILLHFIDSANLMIKLEKSQ